MRCLVGLEIWFLSKRAGGAVTSSLCVSGGFENLVSEQKGRWSCYEFCVRCLVGLKIWFLNKRADGAVTSTVCVAWWV